MAKYDSLYGPWQHFDGSVPAATYRGRTADVKLDIAIGHSGAARDRTHPVGCRATARTASSSRTGREGMHHVQYRVEDADRLDRKLAPLGYRPIWYKRWCADTTFAYLERSGDPLIVEFLEMPPGGPGTRLPG